MLVSSKGRYALRVMLELAKVDDEKYIALGTIADEQEISEKYLESIISTLSKAGMVEGLRGKGGGYRLNRAPDEYTVGEILRLTEGTLAPVSCLDCGPSKCHRASNCKTLPMWEKLDAIIANYLDSVTLADLL
ncbi:MAG: RrF2 family transcriptional regulator [Firmicutes bacterium]|nr:RrF2 family transcriptional regulator [Bacillota bacterium]